MDNEEKHVDGNGENEEQTKKGEKDYADEFLAALEEVEDDENYDDIEDIRYKALKFCQKKGYASAALIQRRFPVGYIKAIKIIDWMEENGFISCNDGTGKRKVIIPQEEPGGLKHMHETLSGLKLDGAAKPYAPRIKIFGVGTVGCKIVNSLHESVNNAEFYLVNDDANELSEFENANKIWIGAEPHGERTFEYGKKAGFEFGKDIEHALYRADMAIVVSGAGGRIGSGTSAAITEIAKENNIRTVAVVSTPFSFEGGRILSNAEKCLKELKVNADNVIIVPCEKIKQNVSPKTPVREAFGVAERTVLEILKTLVEPIVCQTVLNLDASDVLCAMNGAGCSYFGTGTAEGRDRAREAVRLALRYPLNDTEFEGAQGAQSAILYVCCGEDCSLDELMDVASCFRAAVDENCNILFAANIDGSLNGKIKVSVLASKTVKV